MEGIEVFKKLRDACDEIIKAYEQGNEKAVEEELGKFMMLMIQLDALK